MIETLNHNFFLPGWWALPTLLTLWMVDIAHPTNILTHEKFSLSTPLSPYVSSLKPRAWFQFWLPG